MRLFASLFVALVLTASAAQAATLVEYEDGGLAATALFSLEDSGSTLVIELTNTSIAPFGGSNASANMVLSSINFDLGSVSITGGSVSLAGSSTIVKNASGAWGTQASVNLNGEYGYSNTGIGNAPSPVTNALNSVTSHSNGGMSVTTFTGVAGGVGGGLDFGLVAPTSSGFGGSHFVLDSVEIRLSLNSALADLSFLESGSYVEFGSDHLYVPGGTTFIVPEPSVGIAGAALLALAGIRRRFKA